MDVRRIIELFKKDHKNYFIVSGFSEKRIYLNYSILFHINMKKNMNIIMNIEISYFYWDIFEKKYFKIISLLLLLW